MDESGDYQDFGYGYSSAWVFVCVIVFLGMVRFLMWGTAVVMFWVQDGRDAAKSRTFTPTIPSQTTKTIPSTSTQTTSTQRRSKTLHLCVCVGGYRASSTDRSYIHRRFLELTRAFHQSKPQQSQQQSQEEESKEEESKEEEEVWMVGHYCRSNDGQTSDGIEAGGVRVAHEIIQVLQEQLALLLQQSTQGDGEGEAKVEVTVTVTLSFLGVSLGGLYARYAAALLYEQWKGTADGNEMDLYVTNVKVPVRFGVLVTYLTPHLGLASSTYVSLSRTVETWIAALTGPTGNDVFWNNKLLWRMATSPYFTKALSLFHTRVAYANSRHTDWMVSTSSAAFLHRRSSSRHSFIHTNHHHNNHNNKNNGVIGTWVTIQTNVIPTYKRQHEHEQGQERERDERPHSSWKLTTRELDERLLVMCDRLDSLGWRKVFLDVRAHCQIPLSTLFGVTTTPSTELSPPPIIQALCQQSSSSQAGVVVESKQLEAVLSLPLDHNHLHRNNGGLGAIMFVIPLGHNYALATSKNMLLAYVTRGGRPLVNDMIHSFVRDVLTQGQQSQP